MNDHIYQRPLLATDWSAPSENALKAILSFKGVAEKVLITHVIGNKIAKGVGESDLKALEKESKTRLEAYCRVAEEAGLPAESHLSIGRTTPEIMRMSRDYKATMIVMGRTGKDWFQEYWLGGVSHRIAENSELPVLLVP